MPIDGEIHSVQGFWRWASISQNSCVCKPGLGLCWWWCPTTVESIPFGFGVKTQLHNFLARWLCECHLFSYLQDRDYVNPMTYKIIVNLLKDFLKIYWFERERERGTLVCCSTCLCIPWLILAWALTGDWTWSAGYRDSAPTHRACSQRSCEL